MTAVSPSTASMAAMSPILLPGEASSPKFQLADLSINQHRRERSPSIKSPKMPDSPAISPSLSTSATKPLSKYRTSKDSSLQSIASISETSLSGSPSKPGFTRLNSSATTRIASASPQEALKDEKHPLPIESGLGNPRASEHGLSNRYRALSAPVDLNVLDQKLEAIGHQTQSVVVADTFHFRNHGKVAKTPEKPTAQEWVADIDCVSDILGAMLADGDRGRW